MKDQFMMVSVPDEGYFKYASCVLNEIFLVFFIKFTK